MFLFCSRCLIYQITICNGFKLIISQMYLTSLKSVVFLLLILTLTQTSLCPSGKSNVQSFSSLTEDSFEHSSANFDAMYQVKTNNNTGKSQLIGYRLTKVQDITTSNFNVNSFKLNGVSNWKVISVSQLGNCITVDQGQTVAAYQTSQAAFVLVQAINVNTFQSITSNEDCSIIRINISGEEKVYKNSISMTNMIFPKNSIFDSYLVYGIANTQKLYKVGQQNINQISLDTSIIEDTPIALINRKDLNALIFLTKRSSTNKYTLTVLNTLNELRVYSKSWENSQFIGSIKAELTNEGNFILARDNNGFLLLIELIYSSGQLKINEISLQQSTYVSSFNIDSVISLNPPVVISYVNKKIMYFQVFDKLLYFVGESSVNLEETATSFANQNSEKQILIVPTFLGPSELTLCYPAATTNTSESDIANQLEDSTAQTITDASGNTVKCQPECLQCKLGGLCEICSLGYALATNGTCVFCAGCRSCHPEKPEVCYGCFKPQVIDSATNKCVDPFCADTNCESCLLGGICESCFKGYSMHNGLCVKCPEGCETCKNSPTECDKGVCQLGFVFFQDPTISTKYFCVECATGCMSCNLADLTDCTQCNEGFYGLRDSDTNALTCAACMSFCRACTSGNTCDRCQTGYKLNADKTKCVENCDDSCKTCSDDDKNFCTGCYSGSNLSDGKCVADLSCNAAKTCTTCGDGYALKTGECLQCTYTDRNCMGCGSSDLTACLKCVTGFYLSPTRACVKCKPECSGCLNENACFSCSKGFYISKLAGSATGKCLACDVECKTCNQYGYLCTSCPDNYTLEGFKCISNNRVEFSVVIGAEASQFVTIAKEFVQQLIASANKNLGPGQKALTAKDVVLNKIKSGSSVISGAISTKSESFGSAVASSLKSDLSSMSIGGYPVIGVTSEQKVVSVVVDTIPTESNSNVGIILGIMIPIGILVIAGLIVVLIKLKQSRQRMKEDFYDPDALQQSKKQVYTLSDQYTEKI